MEKTKTEKEYLELLAKIKADFEEKIQKDLEALHVCFNKTLNGDHTTLPPNPMFIRTYSLLKQNVVDKTWQAIDAKKREEKKIRGYVS